jgi:hypothetical protein
VNEAVSVGKREEGMIDDDRRVSDGHVQRVRL